MHVAKHEVTARSSDISSTSNWQWNLESLSLGVSEDRDDGTFLVTTTIGGYYGGERRSQLETSAGECVNKDPLQLLVF